jgi:hypothetical protein
MTPGQDPGPPPDHARAETYLRLRAEAELRRVEALPRPDPLAAIGVPAPLRGPVRLAMPLGRRAVRALQPLAENAAQILQPLAKNAAQTLQPLAENATRTVRPVAQDAARRLQPLAGAASQALQPIASQLTGVVLPAAEQTARRLHPLFWRAAARLQDAAPLSWPSRLTGGQPLRPAALTAHDGLRRLGAVARALIQVDAISQPTADAVMASLEAAMVARSRIHPWRLLIRSRRARRQGTARPPAGVYLAAPMGVPAVASPESGLKNVALVTVVVAPDRALLVLAGQVAGKDDQSVHRDPWPVFAGSSGSSSRPTATDDRGNTYALREGSGWSEETGEWDAAMQISPVPPAGTQWLELTMSPGSAPIRVDLAAAGGNAAPCPQPTHGCPAEWVIDSAAAKLLYVAVDDGQHGARLPDLPELADIVTAFGAVGALEPARGAVGRLVTLADRVGVDIPPALRAASPPPHDLPAAWVSVLENAHRRDGPRGMAPAAMALPELDGTRLVLAGLRSYPDCAKLTVMAWGNLEMRGLIEYGAGAPWSWPARDDQGRWHAMSVEFYNGGDEFAELRLDLKPPLHPRATSLEVAVTGRSGQVTATVPLDWRQP